MAQGQSSMFLAALLFAASIAFSQTPNPGNSGGTPPEQPKPQASPDSPPLPPDVKAPDAPPATSDANGNPVTRTLKRLAPNCINTVFHACWSSPPARPQPPQTAERKGSASREVGEFYMERGNYWAAESRFREALEYNSQDAHATFDLAQSLEKLNKLDEALAEYRACIALQSSGIYADHSRKALERLATQASASSKPLSN